MERETSDFSVWLPVVEDVTKNLGLIDSLDAVAELAGKGFGVRLWFVQILGRRWSYLAGEMPEHPTGSDIQRIELERNIGLASDSWEGLTEGHRIKLVRFLNRLIAEKAFVSQS